MTEFLFVEPPGVLPKFFPGESMPVAAHEISCLRQGCTCLTVFLEHEMHPPHVELVKPVPAQRLKLHFGGCEPPASKNSPCLRVLQRRPPVLPVIEDPRNALMTLGRILDPIVRIRFRLERFLSDAQRHLMRLEGGVIVTQAASNGPQPVLDQPAVIQKI